MKIGVRVLGVGESGLEARIAELRARLQQRRATGSTVVATSEQEVSDGKRELGAATGDLRRIDR